MKNIYLFLLAGIFSASSFAQIKVPQPSPTARVEQEIGLTTVKLEYSRPGKKGRTTFGDLVPYGENWRTGANANTIITFADDVTIGGKKLTKGSYAIYTKPGKDKWDVMFYNDTSNWGTPEKWDDAKVALTASAEVSDLPFEMETFTIMFSDLKNDSAILNFVWDKTIASLPIQLNTEEVTMASIESTMSGPTPADYFSAASYYHDSKKDNKKAYEWIKMATKDNADAFWMWRRRSLIEADLGMKKEAIESAKKSMAGAEKANNKDYVKMNKDSLAEWGA